jgi:C4-dicarboxylate transporter/malic acid transport protein
VIGVVANMNPGNQPALKGAFEALAVAMVALGYGFAVALGIPYIARLVRYPVAAWHDLAHPAVGPLFATFPAGLLVLAAATAAVGTRVFPSHTVSAIVAVLAVAGSILAFTLAVTFGYLLFAAPSVEAEQASVAWFIPPVVTIVIPLALVPLVPVATTSMARFLLVASYAAWGMGFFLFLLTAALLYARYVYYPLPKAPLAPAFWIVLGPIGVGGLTLLRMAQVSGIVWRGADATAVSQLSLLAATALWGFGLWWLPLALVLLARYRRAGRLPYGVGWWAFTFPLGAYTTLTLALSRAWNLGVLEGLGAAFACLLAAFWLVVTSYTLVSMRTGLAWRR